jgi:hypothetical protein
MRSQFPRGPIRSLSRVWARRVAVIALGPLAFACGGEESAPPAAAPSPEAAIEQPATPAPEPGAPPATATTPAPDPGGIATDGVIPEGYPSDIPVYPGADPGPAMTMPGLGLFVTFESDDTPEAILTHFRTELANNGWAVQDSADGDGVDGTKEGRSVQVRARTAESGRSEIAVSVDEG